MQATPKVFNLLPFYVICIVQKTISIYGVIGEGYTDSLPAYTMTSLAAAVKQAREEGATAFLFEIDSPGGSVDEAFAMASYIETLKEPTTAYAVNVKSAANLLFFACDERTGDAGSVFMLHQAWTLAEGNADQLEEVAEFLRRESNRMNAYIANRTGLDEEALKGLASKDRFLSYEEAEKLGFFGKRLAPVGLAALVVSRESYTDYPEAASNSARRALDWLEGNGNPNDCLTRVGFARANQLANREALSEDTVRRMAAFERFREDKDTPYNEGCGGIAWDAWGGSAGIEWAKGIVNKLESANSMETTEKKPGFWSKLAAVFNEAAASEAQSAEYIEEEMEEETMDYAAEIAKKDEMIADLQAKLAEMQSKLQGMEEEEKEEEKAIAALSKMVEKQNEQFAYLKKHLTSNAQAAAHFPTFSQAKHKEAEAKLEENSNATFRYIQELKSKK